MASVGEIPVRPQGAGYRAGARRAAAASMVAASIIAVAKLGVALSSGSLAVLSDALEGALDVGLTVMTLLAVRIADKPPDREHPFGHGRAENLAALAQATLLVVLGCLLGVEAARRLLTGVEVTIETWVIVAVGAILIVNLVRAILLRRAARRHVSQALEADAANVTSDVLTSLATMAGISAARLGWWAGDPLAALLVVGIVIALGLRLGVSATNVLMDRAPEGLADRLRDAAGGVEGVVDVRDVRVRRSGPQALAEVDVSVQRTQSVERMDEITRAVQAAVGRAVPGTTAVVHAQPTREGEDVVRRVFAAATRHGLADQVHNVLTIGHPEGLWLMLHAKVDAQMTLGRAHHVADLLERELRGEIEGLARVEIHLEPREPVLLPGRVVTLEREDLVGEVRDIVERHPPMQRCHEVAVTDVGGALHVVAHCEAQPELTIQEIHEASLRAEDDIHRRFPEIAAVTIHFEPAAH